MPPHSIIDTPNIYLEEVLSNDANETLDAELELVSEPTAMETTHTTTSHPQEVSHTPELYDSGATCHMTPLQNSLTNY